MKFILFVSLFLAGCALLNEPAPGPKVITATPESGNCEFPEWNTFGRIEHVSEDTWNQTFDCARKKIDSAFLQVRGSQEGEITVAEIRTLVREGLLKLDVKGNAVWEGVSDAIAIFHPEGRAAFSQRTAHRVLALGKSLVPLLKEWNAANGPKGFIEPARFAELFEKTAKRAPEVIDLFSSHWTLSLERSRSLVRLATTAAQENHHRLRMDETEILEMLEAVWLIKGIFLPNHQEMGSRSDLRMSDIKELISLVTESIDLLPQTLRWATNRVTPALFHSEMPREWERVAQRVKHFFLSREYGGLDSELLSWAMNRLGVPSQTIELVPDLVRLSQRLNQRSNHRGMHIHGIVELLDQTQQFGTWMGDSAPLFAKYCDSPERSLSCDVPLREAVKNPTLAKIALKGGNYAPYRSNSEQETRYWNYELDWATAAGRFVKLALLQKVFTTFDSTGTGKLPLTGVFEEDLRDTLDLTYTMLRLLSTNGDKDTDPYKKIKNEQPVRISATVKPSSLYRLMGLIGDRWMPDGDRDGSLNAEELFSVVQFYEENESYASRIQPYQSAYIPESLAKILGPEDYWRRFEASIFPRHDFIHELAMRTKNMDAAHRKWVEEAGTQVFAEVFHGIVSNTKRKPVVVVPRDSRTPDIKSKTLTDYVPRSESLAPAAIVLALDKLEIVCDKNEDQRFDWKELDCVTPLALDAGYHVITSALIDIEPGVYDLARVLLTFLKRPGLPLSVAKMALATGSFINPLNAGLAEVEKWLKTKSHLDWIQLARWLLSVKSTLAGAEETTLIQEAKKAFLVCDVDQADGELKGEKESDCVTEIAYLQVKESVGKEFAEEAPSSAIENFLILMQSSVIRTGINLGLQKPEVIADLLATQAGVHSSKTSILKLLSELLRRKDRLPPPSEHLIQP